MATIIVSRVHGEYGFEARDQSGKQINMDTSPDHGGENYGVRPMQSLLMALGGCSGIDIVSILKKQRQELKDLTLQITGEREKDKVPALWVKVHVSFIMSGQIDMEKAKYAAALSIDKYCSVAETLRRAGCEISWDVVLDEA